MNTQVLFNVARERHVEALDAAYESRRARLAVRSTAPLRAGFAVALKAVGEKLVTLSETLVA